MKLVFVTGIVTALLAGGVAPSFGQTEASHLVERAQGANPATLLHLGDLALESKRRAQAKQFFKQAKIKLKSGAMAQLGLATLQMGSLRKGKAACRRLSQDFQRSVAGDLCYGRLWLKFGRAARALDVYNELLKKGRSVDVVLGLAKTRALMNQFDEAEALYREAIEMEAGHRAHLGLALILERTGRIDEAIVQLKKGVDAEPDSALVQFHLARLLDAGNEALVHVKAALALRPNWVDALALAGNIELSTRQYSRAAVWFERALKLDNSRGALHLGLGTALFHQNKLELAQKELSLALEQVPNYVEAVLMLADVEQALGHHLKAGSLAEQAVALSPTNADICLRVARLFFRQERLTKAAAYYKRAISMGEGKKEAFVALGDISCARRLYSEGQNYYERAQRLDGGGVSAKTLRDKIRTCH